VWHIRRSCGHVAHKEGGVVAAPRIRKKEMQAHT